MLPLDTRAGTGEAQTPTAQLVSEYLSDLVLADAIAHAIRAIPGVVEIDQGLLPELRPMGQGNTSRVLSSSTLPRANVRLKPMSFLRRHR
jgi:hypothetical protein